MFDFKICLSAIFNRGQSKLTAKYVVASQIAPLFNSGKSKLLAEYVAASQNVLKNI
jgi:hypothetical protein